MLGMRLAAVDIGSNTVHALVADVVRNRLEEVAHYVEMPELGARVARTGSIGTKGRFAIRALRSVVNRARKDGYDKLLAAATEAVREAKDGEAFARQMEGFLDLQFARGLGRRLRGAIRLPGVLGRKDQL